MLAAISELPVFVVLLPLLGLIAIWAHWGIWAALGALAAIIVKAFLFYSGYSNYSGWGKLVSNLGNLLINLSSSVFGVIAVNAIWHIQVFTAVAALIATILIVAEMIQDKLTRINDHIRS